MPPSANILWTYYYLTNHHLENTDPNKTWLSNEKRTTKHKTQKHGEASYELTNHGIVYGCCVRSNDAPTMAAVGSRPYEDELKVPKKTKT